MSSIFERALGADADSLHPKVRERYGFDSSDDVSTVGRGTMEIGNNPLAVPLLWAGTGVNLLFPETGPAVPFRVRNYAFRDSAGREALAIRRTLEVAPTRTRAFDSVTVYDDEHDRLLDVLGTGAPVATELTASVADGALLLEAGDQWARIGQRYVPLPGALSVAVEVRDWYDDDDHCYRVAASVESPLVGQVMRYGGRFQQEQREVEFVPRGIRPTPALDRLPQPR